MDHTSGYFWDVLVTRRTVGMDQKAIGWIDPSALLIGLSCLPALIGSFLLVTNEPTSKTKEKTNLNLLRGQAAGFDVMYEFMGATQDRFEVLFRQPLMVSRESNDSLSCAHELLDWETQCTVHTSILQTTRGKDSVSKEPVCRSIVVSGRRMPSDSQHSRPSPSTLATRSFSYGIVVLLGQSLDQAAVVIGRGFAHSERRPQLKHTYCSMTSPVSRSMAVSTRRVPWHFPHRVMCS
jgi:hypothetical protein